jgi:hypothetical protein
MFTFSLWGVLGWFLSIYLSISLPLFVLFVCLSVCLSVFFGIESILKTWNGLSPF